MLTRARGTRPAPVYNCASVLHVCARRRMLRAADIARTRARARTLASLSGAEEAHALLLSAHALMESVMAPPGLLSAAHWCVTTDAEAPWAGDGDDTVYVFDVSELPATPPPPSSPPPPPPVPHAARNDACAFILPESHPMRCPWCRAPVRAIGAGALPERACELCGEPSRRICQLAPCNHASACRACLMEWACKAAGPRGAG